MDDQTRESTKTPTTREYDIRGKGYIVKSVYIGEKDIKTAILNLAEKKAIREMGIDSNTNSITA